MGQHWYTPEGDPCHWIEMADGRQRDTTLRDARKLNLLPSVTSIMNLLDKPALTNWKMKQVLLASLTLPEIDNEEPDEYAKRIMRDAFKESEHARDRGTEIHDCLESIAKGQPKKWPADIQAIGDAAWEKVVEYCGTDKFTAEARVVGAGYAGMIDLHNDEIVLDYKGKDIKDGVKMAYPEQCMQLAAYDRALPLSPETLTKWKMGGENPSRRCINVFVDRTTPGKVVIHEWKPEEVEVEWERFRLLVRLWQLSKNYFPNQKGAA